MTDPTPRPSIATFLHTPPAKKDEAPPDTSPVMSAAGSAGSPAVPPQGPEAAPASVEAGDIAAGIPVDAAAAPQVTVPDRDATATAAPNFLSRPQMAKAPSRTPRWQWALVSALLALLLLQMLLADRARLAADARWRPLLSGVCAALRCSLPPWHEPQAFSMLGREVRPVPGVAGVLQVRASFRNDAQWPQPWPQLQLSLTDADGRTIGSQVFTPAQYLGTPPAEDALLAPGQSAQVAFRVREPSAGTEAFAFAFH